MKKTLIHISSSPYTGLSCKEGIDLAIVLAVFEQPVDIYLSSAAISLLYIKQQPDPLYGKNLHSLLDVLEFYDINKLFIEGHEESEDHNFWEGGAIRLQVSNQRSFFSQYQQIFRF